MTDTRCSPDSAALAERIKTHLALRDSSPGFHLSDDDLALIAERLAGNDAVAATPTPPTNIEDALPPVTELEMVDYSRGYKMPAAPMYRVMVDKYCIDFETETAANNVRNAILALVSGGVAQTLPEPIHGHGYAIVPLLPTTVMIQAGVDNNPTQWTGDTPNGFAADVANDVYVSMVRASQVSSTNRESCHDHPTRRCTPDDCCQSVTRPQRGTP